MSQNYWSPLSSQVKELPPDTIQQISNDDETVITSNVSDDQENGTKGATAVFDSGATSNCFRPTDPAIKTNKPSKKVFHLPNGATTKATMEAKLHYNVRKPARTVDIIPELKHNALISGSKSTDGGYTTVLTPTHVLIYNAEDVNSLLLQIDKEAILRSWRELGRLWRVPLEPNVSPKQSQYVLLDKKVQEDIANVYELPSTEKIIQYLHACAGFLTKPTWLKAIKGGNYASWPHLTGEAVRKHFP